MKVTLISFAGTLFIRALRATLRIRHVRAKNITATPQYILAFWHRHLLLMFYCAYRSPMTIIISQSKDGEYVARVLASYGIETARGSSTRGGTGAFRGLLRWAREGKNIAFTPDGPKGPAQVVKDGVIVAAKATGLPIIPVAFAAKKKSSCARGTGWSSRSRSRARSSSTATRLSCRVTATWKNGAALSRIA